VRTSLSTSSDGNNIRLGAACAVLALVAVALFGTVPFDREPFSHWDLASYREMARAAPDLARDVSRHFAYRIVGPWLAGIFPATDASSFRVITTVALVATAVAFGLFLRRRGIGTAPSVVAVAAFVFNKHMFGYPAWNPFQVGDALAMLALIALFEAMLRRLWGLFALVFLLGALSRESVLLIVPTALAFATTGSGADGAETRRRQLPRVLTALVPGLVAMLALRATLPVTGETSMLEAFVEHAPKLARVETWLRLLVNVPAPLTALPLVFPFVTLRFFREHPWAALYLVLVFVSTLFGSNNERLMGPAFIVYYWLVAIILQDGVRDRRARTGLLVLVVVTSLDHLYARFPLPSPSYTAWITAASTVAATLVAVLAARGRTSSPVAGYRSGASGPTGSSRPSRER
jgi:hypothetical protein